MILMLTRNVNKEETLKSLLETLGYDVFCSAHLLSALLNRKKETDILHFFPILFLSETIFESEVEQVIKLLGDAPQFIVRITNNVSDVPKRTSDERVYQLPVSVCLEELRDTLDTMYVARSQQNYEAKGARISLSTLEKKIVRQLYDTFPETVTREYLILQLWGDEETTKSRLSSLSNCVHSINKKFEQIYPLEDEKAVRTIWRKGYYLDETIYSAIEEGRLTIM